ncbi:SurA N-terminal domain-containing protein [Candidatus Parcubacteria bacterium]|nr:SurA N-terminal domain-containing protein [Candidatus Parcubacteria bacterium]
MDTPSMPNQYQPVAPVPRRRIRRSIVIAIVVAVILVIVGVLFQKGWLVAATVNGSPISRLSVIHELEKQSGDNALKSIIQKIVIADELKKKNITISDSDVDQTIKGIEAQVTSQGGTLDQALAAQGTTLGNFKEQIKLQKGLEKLLGDKLNVTAAEIDQYIKDNKLTQAKTQTKEAFRSGISDQIKSDKFQTEAQKLVSDLLAGAKIKYYVKY